MALSKVTYVDGVTIIGAKNLNDIQDELIRQGEQQTADEEATEAALALKADKSTTYTKTEVDSALALKADKSDTYTKAQVNASLALKADKSDTYTKAEVDSALSGIIDPTLSIAGKAADAKKTGAGISDLKSDIGLILQADYPENVFNNEWVVDETINQGDGSFIPHNGYARTDFIPIKAGTVNIGIKYTGSLIQVVTNYCVYNSAKEKVTFGNGNALPITIVGDMSYSTITVEQDGYIALNIYKQNRTLKYYVSSNVTPTKYVDYYEPVEIINPILFDDSSIGSMTYGKTPSQVKKDSFVDGETMVVESNSIKKHQLTTFFAKVTSFDTLYIGHGQGSYGYYIKIDNTNMTYMSDGTSGTAIAHGLTIEDYICVIISVDLVLNSKITIITKSGQFTRTQGGWTGTKDEIFAKNENSILTDAILTWNSDDYKKAVWAFGDSYFATNTNIRWTYWAMTAWGFDNALLNGYAGAASESAYTDLITALKHGTPKYLLWCLGMNDHDTSSAANATWLEKVEAIKTICKRRGITLILATIPNVVNPAYNNTHKNQYVRESGYRYVDFAEAVEGVSGWLSDDNVHPSEIGARLLAAKAITDCPELMQSV